MLNQRVYITQHPPAINGFYPVEVKLANQQSVMELLLSNDVPSIVRIRFLRRSDRLISISLPFDLDLTASKTGGVSRAPDLPRTSSAYCIQITDGQCSTE